MGRKEENIKKAKTLMATVQGDVETKVAALKALLEGQGVIGADDYVIVPQDISVDQAKALFNYKLVIEDQSKGIHAPRYVKALLDNSIELITP